MLVSRAAITGAIKRRLLDWKHYARRLERDRFPGVAVLCYHGIRDDSWPEGTMALEGTHVRAAELSSHCRVLREYCHPISLAQLRAALDGGPPLPPRPTIISFDDGYRTVFTLARPILQRYSVPAVVFISSDYVEARRLFWWDALARAYGEGEVERIKSWPFEQWQRLRAAHAQTVSDADPSAPLTVAELQALADTPGFEIGGHTKTHPVLARASRNEQWEQITADKERLEEWTGQRVRAFAYPNGRPGEDYTAETVDVVRDAGFEVAFTTRSGFAGRDQAPLEYPRFVIRAGVSAAELAHRLCYSWRRS